MAAATSVTKTGESAIRGGIMQFWSCNLVTTAITSAGQQVDTVTIPGTLSGDVAFVNARAPIIGIIFQGASVTATDVVSVYSISNWVTALATSAQVLDICINKKGKGADTTSA